MRQSSKARAARHCADENSKYKSGFLVDGANHESIRYMLTRRKDITHMAQRYVTQIRLVNKDLSHAPDLSERGMAFERARVATANRERLRQQLMQSLAQYKPIGIGWSH